MRKITVRKVDWRIFIINLIAVVIPLYFIVSYTYKLQNTTIQTVFIIGCLSILGGINFLIIKSGTYLIDINLKDNEIEILSKAKVIYNSKYEDIHNYNIYYFINKKGGYILRISSKTKSFCALLTWLEFDKINDIDRQSYNIIKDTLKTEIIDKKKIKGIDYILKIFSAMPYIFLGIAALFLVGIFIYLISI